MVLYLSVSLSHVIDLFRVEEEDDRSDDDEAKIEFATESEPKFRENFDEGMSKVELLEKNSVLAFAGRVAKVADDDDDDRKPKLKVPTESIVTVDPSNESSADIAAENEARKAL